MIRKVKREKHYIQMVADFMEEVEHWYEQEANMYQYITSEHPYKGKLVYYNNIIFDLLDNLAEVMLWDIGDFGWLDTVRFNEVHYETQNFEERIAGNQFVEAEIEYTTKSVAVFLMTLIESSVLELSYHLDAVQQKVCHDFNNTHQVIQAITGGAGAGKTLVLYRLAHKAVIEGKRYIYITFTKSLKDQFKDYIYALNKTINRQQSQLICTFEEFLREMVGPLLHIDHQKYITFEECQKRVEGYFKTSPQLLESLALSDVVRIIMSILTNIDESTTSCVLKDLIQFRLDKIASRKDLYVSKGDVELVFRVSKSLVRKIYKQENRYLWGDYLRHVQDKLEKEKLQLDVDVVFVDEMQDLSQLEFNLLKQIVLNHSAVQKFVVTYDKNQRIAVEGSSVRNLHNRVNVVPEELPYSYRNSPNIFRVAQKFLGAEEGGEAQNTSTIRIAGPRVKVLLERDIEHIVEEITSSFIPEKDLNIGIIALGANYDQYKHYFIDEYNRSKIPGIEFFNELNIKGLEFTNLIILDFMGIATHSDEVGDNVFRKWYVAITRASDNLMIHLKTQQDLEQLDSLLQQRLNHTILEEELLTEGISMFTNFEDAFEAFRGDLLTSLGSESKSLFIKEAKQLIDLYKSNQEMRFLEDAIALCYQADALSTLRTWLESIHNKKTRIYIELCKVAMHLRDDELLDHYIIMLSSTERNRLYFLGHQIQCELSEAIREKWHIKFDVATYIEKRKDRIRKLKKEGSYDQIIELLYHDQSWDEIIKFAKKTKPVNYSSLSRYYIEIAYKSSDQLEEAIHFFMEEKAYEKAIKLYEIQGLYEKAYSLAMEWYESVAHTNDEESVVICERIVDLSLKLKKEECYLHVLEKIGHLTTYKIERIYFELYLSTLNISHIVKTIEIYYRHINYKAIIRCYNKVRQIAKVELQHKTLEMIAIAQENENLINDAAQLQSYMGNFIKAIELFYEIKQYDDIVEIHDCTKEVYNSSTANKIARSYEYLDMLEFAKDVYLENDNYVECLYMYMNRGLSQEVVSIYEQCEEEVFDVALYKDVQRAMEAVQVYEQCAVLSYKHLNQYGYALELYMEKCGIEEAITLFKKLKDSCQTKEELMQKLTFKEVQDVKKQQEGILRKIAAIYVGQEKYEEALFIYKLLRTKEFITCALQMHYALGEYEALITYKDECGNNYERSEEVVSQIGSAYEQCNQYKKAIDNYLDFSQTPKFLDKIVALFQHLPQNYDSRLIGYSQSIKILIDEEAELFEQLMCMWHERIEKKWFSQHTFKDMLEQGSEARFFKQYMALWDGMKLLHASNPMPGVVAQLMTNQKMHGLSMVKSTYNTVNHYLAGTLSHKRVIEGYCQMIVNCGEYRLVHDFVRQSVLVEWEKLKATVNTLLDKDDYSYSKAEYIMLVTTGEQEINAIRAFQRKYKNRINDIEQSYKMINNFLQKFKLNDMRYDKILYALELDGQTLNKAKEILKFTAALKKYEDKLQHIKERVDNWQEPKEEMVQRGENELEDKTMEEFFSEGILNNMGEIKVEKESMARQIIDNKTVEEILLEKEVDVALKVLNKGMGIEEAMDFSGLSEREIKILMIAFNKKIKCRAFG